MRPSETASRWLLFIAGAALIALRYPDLVAEPRLWGEEGVVFLQRAYEHPWYETIFAPQIGYLCLFASLPTTVAAHFVRLEYVPYFTTGCAFAAQLIPLALIVWGRAALWSNLVIRALGIVIMVLNPLGEETWLGTNVVHFHFPLVVFLVFLEQLDAEPAHGRWILRCLVVLSGLSGPPACLLLPLFLAHAVVTRRKEAMVRAALLSAVTLLQLAIVLYSLRTEVNAQNRYASFDLGTAASVLLNKTIFVPMLGLGYGNAFGVLFDRAMGAGPDAVTVWGVLCSLVVAAWLAVLARQPYRRRSVAYLGAWALLGFSSMYLGIGSRRCWVYPSCAGRYFYAPGVILSFLLLSQLDLRRPLSFSPPRRWFPAGLLALSLVMQAAGWGDRFFAPERQPRWRDEVAKWRKDRAHRLRVWPEGWSMEGPRDQSR